MLTFTDNYPVKVSDIVGILQLKFLLKDKHA